MTTRRTFKLGSGEVACFPISLYFWSFINNGFPIIIVSRILYDSLKKYGTVFR